MLNADKLPNDIEALKTMLFASKRRVQERDDQVAALNAQLNTRAAEIEHLKLQIAKHAAHAVRAQVRKTRPLDRAT